MAATVLGALVGVYGPLVIAFPWMWSGGRLHPIASLLFTAVTPASWLAWHGLVSSSLTTSRRRWTALASGALTLLYGISVVADFLAGSPHLWPPSLLVAAVGYALVARWVWRRWREPDGTQDTRP